MAFLSFCCKYTNVYRSSESLSVCQCVIVPLIPPGHYSHAQHHQPSCNGSVWSSHSHSPCCSELCLSAGLLPSGTHRTDVMDESITGRGFKKFSNILALKGLRTSIDIKPYCLCLLGSMAHSSSFVLRFVVANMLCHLKHHSEIYYQALEETAISHTSFMFLCQI